MKPSSTAIWLTFEEANALVNGLDLLIGAWSGVEYPADLFEEFRNREADEYRKARQLIQRLSGVCADTLRMDREEREPQG